MSNCGFLRHPSDPNYEPSPDSIAKAFLVEVKTRAEDAEMPLEKVTGSQMSQTHFQICCSGEKITLLILSQKRSPVFFSQKETIC